MAKRDDQQVAMSAAIQLRSTLGLSDEQPVNVLDVIHQVGVWLTFQPMKGILGVTLREGNGGILIGTQRGPAVQRFTAAHELGHWLLHQEEPSWDTEADIESNSTNPKEIQANAFATELLMPRYLFNLALKHYNVGRHDDVSPEVIYLVSRDLGVSYAAAVNRTSDIRRLPFAEKRALQNEHVLDIKKRLLGGRVPEDHRAHIWLRDPQDAAAITLDVGDEIFADMPENPTTGYRWEVTSRFGYDHESLMLAQDTFSSDDRRTLSASESEALVGEGGVRHFRFRAVKAGPWEEVLALRRPFEPPALTVQSQPLSGTVRETPMKISSAFNAPPIELPST